MHDIFFLVEQGSVDPPSAVMMRHWLAATLAFYWVCVGCCVCVLLVATPYRFPRATVQLNPSLELLVCLKLAGSMVLKLNKVLQSLCALIISFPSLFLFLGMRALQNWIMQSLGFGRGCVLLLSLCRC